MRITPVATALFALAYASPVVASTCGLLPGHSAGRNAYEAADLVAEVMIGDALPMPFCSNGSAPPRDIPEGAVTHASHAARVVRLLKGPATESFTIRSQEIRNLQGQCVTLISSSDVAIRPGQAGPMLFEKVGDGEYRAMAHCSQYAFAKWLASQDTALAR